MNTEPRKLANMWPNYSQYATRWLARFPEWDSEEFSDKPLLDCIDYWLIPAKAAETEAQLMTKLRLARNRSLIEIMKRDLLGTISLFEVTEAMSLLADFSVQLALEHAHRAQAERYGQPEQGANLIVVGMGKLGGLELNVSSDIDLVFLYGFEGQTEGGRNGKSQSHAEFFTQIGRKLIKILSEVTEDGFVFRVDMRLRPNGDSGPLAASLQMLEEYFVVQGREWERYAWIKARVLNWCVEPDQDAAYCRLTKQVDSIVQPFVYRRYLDYGAIDALRKLHKQIRKEARKQALKHPDTFNVKLGRGGIREIEFIAQAFQLIRGGRDLELQRRRTVDVLEVCKRCDVLTPDEFDRLTHAYRFLRDLEHRLQYENDAQTHWCPTTASASVDLASTMGYTDPDSFLSALKAHLSFVSDQFDRIFADQNEDEETRDLTPPWPTNLTHGFEDPAAAEKRYLAWIDSAKYNALPDRNQERVDRLMPALLAAAGASSAPDQCWRGCCELVEAIAKRGAYLSLLDEYPIARMRLTRLFAASRWAGQFLTRHPVLLDELLDTETLLSDSDFQQWHTRLERALDHTLLDSGEPDIERRMDLLRDEHHVQQFHILIQDLEDLLPVPVVSDLLSKLADYTLALALDQAWATVPKQHREKPQFAVIGYGKYGGKELGYASDLDLVFLYDDGHDQAPELYARLAKRLTQWLSAQTSAGYLFDTDFRLRPDGDAGLLVANIHSFEAYQNRKDGLGAWFWEHQALTRARFCAGDSSIGARFESIRQDVLRLPREWSNTQKKVKAMRQKMHEGHPNPTELFDIKHDPGGMVDVEFMVQALILTHAHDHPSLCENLGNITLLRKLSGLGLLDEALATEVADSYRGLRAHQHVLRLAGLKSLRTQAPQILDLARPVQRLWKQLFG